MMPERKIERDSLSLAWNPMEDNDPQVLVNNVLVIFSVLRPTRRNRPHKVLKTTLGVFVMTKSRGNKGPVAL